MVLRLTVNLFSGAVVLVFVIIMVFVVVKIAVVFVCVKRQGLHMLKILYMYGLLLKVKLHLC